jgi:hypothetical protein
LEDSDQSFFKVISWHLSGGLRKTTESSLRKAGVTAEVQTEHLPNTSLEHFCYSNLFETLILIMGVKGTQNLEVIKLFKKMQH